MSKYEKLTPNQLIKLLENKDKLIENKDILLEDLEKTLADKDAPWSSSEAKDRMNRGAEGAHHLKLGFRLTILDDILSDDDYLHAYTWFDTEKFTWILYHFTNFILENEDKMPLFDMDGSSRSADAGNRCKLAPKYALLLALMRKKANLTQEQLGASFSIDQSTVCRYLKIVDEILERILQTARNITDFIIQSVKNPKLRQKILAMLGHIRLLDGTFVPIQRPGDSEQRKALLSGKNKRYGYNTVLITDMHGIILFISRSYPGTYHDFKITKEEIEEILEILQPLSKNKKIILYTDKGFVGIGKYLDKNMISMQPIKTSKNNPVLTRHQQAQNLKINKVRVHVEHDIRWIKSYARMVDPYDGTREEFETEFNVVTGLANVHRMWKKIKSKCKKGQPPPTWTSYFD